MKTTCLVNFSVEDLLCEANGRPVNKSIFLHWIAGGEPRIDQEFFYSARHILNQATRIFCDGGYDEMQGGNLAKLTEKMVSCLEYTAKLIPKSNPTYDPFEFYCYCLDFECPEFMFGEKLEYETSELISMFALICVDKTISSLLEMNVKESAKFSMYSGTCLTILNYFQDSEVSINARKGGKKRHELDPKQEEKKFVFECWTDWQEKTHQYKSKAEFARSMLGKCEHLTSQKKIEDWCREWGTKSSNVTQPAQ